VCTWTHESIYTIHMYMEFIYVVWQPFTEITVSHGWLNKEILWSLYINENVYEDTSGLPVTTTQASDIILRDMRSRSCKWAN
jgi:hypothetical protein